MTSSAIQSDLDDLRRRKALFDTTWLIAISFASATVLVSWYLGLSQVDVRPVVWVLASLAIIQLTLAAHAGGISDAATFGRLVLLSQFIGLLSFGAAWHLYGGLQQPAFALFGMLPLFAGALVLSFWQRHAALALLLVILLSGVFLTPDTNSFIDERYGIHLGNARWLPAWLPRSRVAFADVTTTPAYDIMMSAALALVAIALSTISGAIITLFEHRQERANVIHEQLEVAQRLNHELVAMAPDPEVLVHAVTGRVICASESFLRQFSIQTSMDGEFLLDTVAFTFPAVVKRLLVHGGEDIQGATVGQRDLMLRVRAASVGGSTSQVVRVTIEPCTELCWRAALDALDDVLLVINSRDEVVFLNRPAAALFGTQAHAGTASGLFEDRSAPGRWWDIAPLDSARRLLDYDNQSYLVSIRRERLADSIGEFCFVHLRAREPGYAVAVS